MPSVKDNVRVFIYTKAKKPNNFIYKKARYFAKSKTISVTFLYTKKRKSLFVIRFFMKFWSWHLYTKSMTVCVTWCFYIQKARHFAKTMTICVRFLYTKIITLYVTRFFIEVMKLAEGGGGFNAKMNALCATFYFAKNNALCVMFLYTEWVISIAQFQQDT